MAQQRDKMQCAESWLRCRVAAHQWHAPAPVRLGTPARSPAPGLRGGRAAAGHVADAASAQHRAQHPGAVLAAHLPPRHIKIIKRPARVPAARQGGGERLAWGGQVRSVAQQGHPPTAPHLPRWTAALGWQRLAKCICVSALVSNSRRRAVHQMQRLPAPCRPPAGGRTGRAA